MIKSSEKNQNTKCVPTRVVAQKVRFCILLDLFYTKIIQYILRSQKSSYNFEIVCYIVLLLYCSSIRYLIRHIKRINFRLMLFDTFWSDDRALMNYRRWSRNINNKEMSCMSSPSHICHHLLHTDAYRWNEDEV